MSTKAKIFVALGVTAAFVVGVGAGSAAGMSEDPLAKPLHSPTVTVTQAATMQHRTPRSCLVALNAAEDLTGDASDFSTTASQYPDLIRRALLAGYNQDLPAIRGITADIESITAEVRSETASVGRHGDVFSANAAACRSTS
jgi:hypothetical protein